MTLILKSNVMLRQKKLTDVINDAVLNLDFRDEVYYRNGGKVGDITTLISTVSSYGGYYSTTGKFIAAPADTIKIGIDRDSHRKGLITEGGFQNFYPYSNAPVSHTMTKSTATLKVTRVVATGSGSVVVRYNGVNLGEAREGIDIQLPLETVVNGSLELTVKGSLSFLMVVDSEIAKPIYSRILQGIRKPDFSKINPDVVSALLPQSEGTVVSRIYMPADVVDPHRGPVTLALLTIIGAVTTDGYFASKHITNTYDSSLYSRKDGVATGLEYNHIGLGSDIIVALSFTKTGKLTLYMNGILVGTRTVSPVVVSQIGLGSTNTWNLIGLTITEEVAIYNRVLSGSEMALISSLV